MREIRVAAAQFEHSDGDKVANLEVIRRLATKAVRELGAEVVCFHECSITGYTWLQRLSRDELFDLAEPLRWAVDRSAQSDRRELGAVIMAG